MKGSHLFGRLEIKEANAGKRTFAGILSTSHLDEGNWFFKDIVWPGAFKRTLDHFKKSSDPYIPLLDTHDSWSVMNALGTMTDGVEVLTGKTLKYEKDDGLTLDVPEMHLETEWKVIKGPDGERLLERIDSGAVRKMSMGYKSFKEDFVELKTHGRVRNLREVGLKEGSLVIFPMNPNADVLRDTVKSSLATALRDLDSLDAKDRDEILEEFRALLLKTQPTPARVPESTAGLAHDDPKRLARESRLRDLSLRLLATT